MGGIVLSGAELNLLYDEPAELLKLYVYIRQQMDFATGISGLTYRFNEAFLFEVLCVARVAGRHTPKPVTRKLWRNSLDRLIKLGLLRPRPDLGNLVFEHPLAAKDMSSQNRKGQGGAKEGPEEGPKNAPKNQDKSNHSDLGRDIGESEEDSRKGQPLFNRTTVLNTPSLRSGGSDSTPPDQKALPPPASGDLSPLPTQKKKGGQLSPEMQEACRATWKAYADAYFARYGVDPVRNAKVNSQIIELVKRLGIQEAPQVAAWYLTHTSAYYIRTGHSIGALLADAEKLRTEWATGRRMTETQARQTDRAGTTASHVHDILAERRARR